jgi:hypothetical protein
MAVKKDKVNWTYLKKDVENLQDMPPDTLGFIYRIDNLTTGKYYIGRKTVASKKKKKLTAKEKLLPENKRKTFKYEVSESSGWKTYVGSNTILKEEIKEGHKYKKTILHYCFSKAEITFLETKEIICGGALEDPKSYNGWVKCTIYKQHLLENK